MFYFHFKEPFCNFLSEQNKTKKARFEIEPVFFSLNRSLLSQSVFEFLFLFIRKCIVEVYSPECFKNYRFIHTNNLFYNHVKKIEYLVIYNKF